MFFHQCKIHQDSYLLELCDFMLFKNRDWGNFKNSFATNFNGMGTFVTVTGGFLGAVGYFINNGLYLSLVGIALIIGSLIWAIYKSWPEIFLTLEDFKSHIVPIADLNGIRPIPFTVGLMGRSKSGKTTFLHKTTYIRNKLTRTNEIYANIVQLPSHLKPNGKLIIIDGDGKQFNQQFNIMGIVDILIIFFDHNESGDNVKLRKLRLKEHEDFIDQVISNLKHSKNLKHIHLVINKYDLWGNSVDREFIIKWGDEMLSNIEKNCDIKVTISHTHSNNIQDSIAETLEKISEVKGELYEEK